MKQVVMEADTTAETRVMCYKRMADYARVRLFGHFLFISQKTAFCRQYCCDLQLIDVSTFHGLSTTYYTTAAEIAEADTSATSPVRLGLALSWSVWHAEILNDRNFALRIAQSAFDKALLDLDQLDGKKKCRDKHKNKFFNKTHCRGLVQRHYVDFTIVAR